MRTPTLPADHEPAAVEVQTIFRGVTIGTKLLVGGTSRRRTFAIGADRRVDAPAEVARLAAPRHELVALVAGGFRVEVTPRMDGVLEHEGRAVPLAEVTGREGLRFVPPPGARLRIDCGETTFIVAGTAAPPRIPRPPAVRLGATHGYFALAAAPMLALLAAAFSLPQDRHTLALLPFSSRLALSPPAAAGQRSLHRPIAPGAAQARATATIGAEPDRPTPAPRRPRVTTAAAQVRGLFGVFDSAAWRALAAPSAPPGEAAALLDVRAPAASATPDAASASAACGADCRREPRSPALAATAPARAMEREVIRRVMRKHADELRACYEQERAAAPAGRLLVELTIDGGGRVARAAPLASFGQPAIDACVVAAVLRWSFPPALGGGAAVVRYPFWFTRA